DQRLVYLRNWDDEKERLAGVARLMHALVKLARAGASETAPAAMPQRTPELLKARAAGRRGPAAPSSPPGSWRRGVLIYDSPAARLTGASINFGTRSLARGLHEWSLTFRHTMVGKCESCRLNSNRQRTLPKRL